MLVRRNQYFWRERRSDAGSGTYLKYLYYIIRTTRFASENYCDTIKNVVLFFRILYVVQVFRRLSVQDNNRLVHRVHVRRRRRLMTITPAMANHKDFLYYFHRRLSDIIHKILSYRLFIFPILYIGFTGYTWV